MLFPLSVLTHLLPRMQTTQPSVTVISQSFIREASKYESSTVLVQQLIYFQQKEQWQMSEVVALSVA